MEDLIAQYLFLHKQCPLPEVGLLKIQDGTAVLHPGDNTLSAPLPFINFTRESLPAAEFVAFIAKEKSLTNHEALSSLQLFCSGLQQLVSGDEKKLDHAGTFIVDKAGNLIFQQEPVTEAFIPTIPLKRVLQPKPASHDIRVGDNNTTSTLMTEYYSEKGIVKKERWWIAAVILAIIAIVVLYFYFIDHRPGDQFGQVQPAGAASAGKTYDKK